MGVTITFSGLSNRMQAALMLLAFLLPPLVVWTSAGMPMDKTALGLVFAALLSGLIAFIKEIMGGSSPATAVPAK